MVKLSRGDLGRFVRTEEMDGRFENHNRVLIMPQLLAKRAALHTSSQTATTGSLYPAASFYGNPVARYTYK